MVTAVCFSIGLFTSTMLLQQKSPELQFGTGMLTALEEGECLALITPLWCSRTQPFRGGGIRVFGWTTILNSTISGNSSAYSGGGLYFHLGMPCSSVAIFNSTIALNTATVGGAGIQHSTDLGTISIRNSLIARNVITNGLPAECAGAIISQGYNLLKNNTGCNFIATTGDQVGTNANPIDPLLSSLQNNGGTTFTHALSPYSPAVDAGDPAGCRNSTGGLLTIDQRGYNRTTDGDLDGIAICDIGAIELPALPNRIYLPVALR
jgi:hypothetical protein